MSLFELPCGPPRDDAALIVPGGVPGQWTQGARFNYTNCPAPHRDMRPWRPSGDLQLGIVVLSNGSTKYALWCPLCRCSCDVRKAAALSWGLPVQWRRVNDANPQCEYEGCNLPGELHHFAPVNWFGFQEAEHWPKAWLCPPHHREWHRRMNGYQQFAKSVDWVD